MKEKGYKLLTVKIGIDPEDDLKRVRAVKKAVGDSVSVEVDGNEAYTLDVAIKYIKQMDEMIAKMTDAAKQKEATMHLDMSKAEMKKGNTAECMKHMEEAHKAMGM